jgi:hypothetical protein
MPILALGEYSAKVKPPGPDLHAATAVTFIYLPLHIPFLLTGVLVLAGIVRSIRRIPGYSAARYAVFAPGIAGIVLAWYGIQESIGEELFIVGMAIQVPTAVFLAWRVLRARKTLRAVLLAPVVSAVVFTANFFISGELPDAQTLLTFLVVSLIFIWPLIVLRFVCRNRASWQRIIVGLLAGLLPVAMFLVLFFFAQGGGDLDEIIPILGIIMIPAVISAGFIRWNAWARDIVTGNPAAFASGTETSPAASGEVPAAG